MNSSDWRKIKEVFTQTLDLPEAERGNFLSNFEGFVQTEVTKLLDSHSQAETFIEQPFIIENGFIGNDSTENLVGKTINNYQILEKIGEGGMGTVYLAERKSEDFSTRFALKIIKRGMDTNAVLKRFLMERQILASLESPFIAKLFDGSSTTDGLPFFVMEYVEGKNIREFCDEYQFDTKERLEIFLKVCQAIAYAHQKLIVHRDIKPSNIIVTADGTPKLLDFGIAKLINPDWNISETEATTMQSQLLTPQYASPEQLAGKPTTTTTDVYSLGIVLYELLTGSRPYSFKSRNPFEISQEIITNEPPRPSSVVNKSELNDKPKTRNAEENNRKSEIRNPKSLKGDLDNIILKAISRESERRYQSVQEFSEDIRRHLKGLPVSATADSTFYRFSKFINRHRQGVIIGSLAVFVILFVSGFAFWQGIVAVRERQKAEKRLMEIRNVAKSLMNETNDSLSMIPGNVKVQKALAEKSVALLDSLANEETDDIVLLAELADAYTNLSFLQNWSFREFEKAIGNLEKAETIYQKILERNPTDIEIRRKIYGVQMRHIEALHNTNRREEMFAVATEAIENRREIINLEPENPSNYANLAAMFGWFGDKNLLFGRKTEAVENYRKGVAIIENAIEKQSTKLNSVNDKAELARLTFIKGWLNYGADETGNAVESYRKAAEIAGEVFQEDADFEGNFERILVSYERIAEIFENAKEYQSALENYQTSLKWLEKGFADKRMTNQKILAAYNCYYSVYAGKITKKAGRKTESEKYFTEGEAACRKNIAQDENDESNIIDTLSFFYEIADHFAETGENEKAMNQLLDLSKKLQILLDKNQNDLTAAFSLAETYEKIGDLANIQKKEFYERSINIWRQYGSENLLVPEETAKMNRVIAKSERFGKE